jgi:hypothetical protein
MSSALASGSHQLCGLGKVTEPTPNLHSPIHKMGIIKVTLISVWELREMIHVKHSAVY